MRRTAALAMFLLRTFYFSPVNNPVWFVLAPMVLVYVMTGLMGRHEVLLFMLAAAATHRFMRTFRGRATDDGSDPLRSAFRLLPVSTDEIRRASLASVVVYALVLGIGFTGLLMFVDPPPPWEGEPQAHTRVLPTGDTLTYYTGTIMDRSGAHHIPVPYTYIPPISAVVGSLQRLPVWPLWVLVAFAGLLLTDAWLHHRPRRSGALAVGIGSAVGVVHALGALVVMIDKVLPNYWRVLLTVQPAERFWLMGGFVLVLLTGVLLWAGLVLRREEGGHYA
ncbi:MAG: hypothetical protein GF331_22630 [Chitinivibrionales bacterium]|nr:hypothetical protein [Chitinivibrionales bacterium]